MARTDTAEGRRILEALAAELERRGVTADEIGRLSRLSMWQTVTKDGDGVAETHDLYGFQLSPSWDDGPEWPVVQPAAPVKVPAIRKPASVNDLRVTVILPDPQIGYHRTPAGELLPIHDPDAMDVALQLARHARADRIVNLGDSLDFAELSTKWATTPEAVQTTQPAIQAAHEFFARQRSIAEEVDVLEGNHDKRLADLMIKNAMAACRLRKATDPPDAWPVLSVPYLLELDRIGVRYHDGYPSRRIKIADGNDNFSSLWATHGAKLDVRKVAERERVSIVQGHIHRIVHHEETYEIDGRPVIVRAFSPGCLCRVDGAVPSVHGAVTGRGVPLEQYENWQQGIAVVTEGSDGWWSVETVPIHAGRAVWRGKVFEA